MVDLLAECYTAVREVVYRVSVRWCTGQCEVVYRSVWGGVQGQCEVVYRVSVRWCTGSV